MGSYLAPNATFSLPGLPGVPLLRGSVVMEKPMRFRLRAGTTLSGEEIDLGSNDELYWLWAKRNEPPAVYFARHGQTSPATTQLLPIEPGWVIDALGLLQLDPAAAYRGPLPRADGTMELRHTAAGPAGPIERVTVVEPARGWVIEQHLYDRQGQLLASATATDFRYHPTAAATLPERVTIAVPRAGLSLTVNTGAISVNTPIANPQQQWSLPHPAGYPQVDLGRSDGLPVSAVGQPVVGQPGVASSGTAAYPSAYPAGATRPAVGAAQPAMPPPPGSGLAPLQPPPAAARQPPRTAGYQQIPSGGVPLPGWR
ncbi:MAG: hypothetical protein AAF790_01160 [Planctomycetota bacterium]